LQVEFKEESVTEIKPTSYLNHSKAKGKIGLSLQMASSEMRAAVSVWYLQALATSTFRETGDMWLLLGIGALFCSKSFRMKECTRILKRPVKHFSDLKPRMHNVFKI